MKRQVEIHQIYFREDQKPFLDPVFAPYDNSGNAHPEQMEYRVFLDAWDAGKIERAPDLIGFLSWKFRRKTLITGARFIEFVNEHPGFDAYFINPFPRTLAWKNVWLQGEFHHPGLIDFTQPILNKLGYNLDLKSMINDDLNTAFCNYWVATADFWQQYLNFTRPLYDYLIKDASPQEREFLWRRASPTINSSYFPFIFERMFTTFLTTRSDAKCLGYVYNVKELMVKPMPYPVKLYLACIYLFSNLGSISAGRLIRQLYRTIHKMRDDRPQKTPTL